MPKLDTPYAALPSDAAPFDWSHADGDIEVDPMISLPDGGCEPGSPPDFFSVFAHFAVGLSRSARAHRPTCHARRAVVPARGEVLRHVD